MKHVKLIKNIRTALLAVSLCLLWTFAAWADNAVVQYEYKIVRLGSLSGLQKEKADGKNEKVDEIEGILNQEGLEGWDIVNIFAVRTAFDPNVFFVAMKRALPRESNREN